MAGVEIRNVVKSYGGLDVIHGVDIHIPDGQFVVLVGPSGCGKSTLLRIVAGLESLTSGEILIGTRRVNNVPPRDRDIAMVFQNYALYPHMSVEENMNFSLRLRREPRDSMNSMVQRSADILGLSSLLPRLPRQLSGGQRQRVAMGRAIVRDPQVFLFDEPLSNLDAKLRVQMRAEIKELHQRLGTTTIYVTHDQVEAMTLADQIVVLKEGVIQQSGAPMDLYERPANLFVAEFLGSPSMNFLRGAIERMDDGARFRTLDGHRLPLGSGWASATGRSVIYGIRPEDIRIAESGVDARLTIVEPTGSEIQAFGQIGKQRIVALVRDRKRLDPGADVKLLISPELVHVFDPETGDRLAA